MEEQTNSNTAILSKLLSWERLPKEIKQKYSASTDYYEELKKYCFDRRINFNSIGKGLQKQFKDPNEYYQEMTDYLCKGLHLYPYQFHSLLVNELKITPFSFYHEMMLYIMKNEKSYDILPNFTAVDSKRLIGIGRNEYIELINRARSKKLLWKLNKSKVITELLPSKCLDTFNIDYWWEVQLVSFASFSDFNKLIQSESNKENSLTEAEKSCLLYLKVKQPFSMKRSDSTSNSNTSTKGSNSLNSKDQIPNSKDQNNISTGQEESIIEDVVNQGNLEKDDQKDKDEKVESGRFDRDTLVSLYKRGLILFEVPMKESDRIVIPTLKNFIMNRKPTDFFEKIIYNILYTIDDRTSIREISTILDVSLDLVIVAVQLCCMLGFALKKLPSPKDITIYRDSWKKSIKDYHSLLSSSSTDVEGKEDSSENKEGKDSNYKEKRVGFVFDNSLAAHLMFGNLGSEIKRHAVTLFEIGKLTDEYLSDFLKHLDTVKMPDKTVGEARVFYQVAISLKQTLRFLRGCLKIKGCNGNLDMLRCESLQHLDSETKLKILKTNYFMMVTQAPLRSKVSLPVCLDNFFGASLSSMNSPWFKFYLYSICSAGPLSLLLKKGSRVPLLPGALIDNEKVLFTAWDNEPTLMSSMSIVQTLNDTLLQTPAVVQQVKDNFDLEKITILDVVFPFDSTDLPEECSQSQIQQISVYMEKIIEKMHLQYSFGIVKFLKISIGEQKYEMIPLELLFGIVLDNDINGKMISAIQKKNLMTLESLDKHNQSMKDLTQDFINFLDKSLEYKVNLESPDIYPTKSLLFDGKNLSVLS